MSSSLILTLQNATLSHRVSGGNILVQNWFSCEISPLMRRVESGVHVLGLLVSVAHQYTWSCVRSGLCEIYSLVAF